MSAKGIDGLTMSEPWFNTKLSSLSGSDKWQKKDEIIWNQINRQTDKHNFYINAFDFISDNKIYGDYHEFGCHRCRTFRMAMLEAARHFLNEMNFYAYDSFQGMPQDNNSDAFDQRWNAGMLSTSKEKFRRLIKESGFNEEKVFTIEGFYDETLQNLNFEKMLGGKKASLVAIDCDLYESAVPIFDVLDQLLQEGTIIYIDDYFTGYKGNPKKGVSKAMKEWEKITPWLLESYRDVGWAGKSYIVYK